MKQSLIIVAVLALGLMACSQTPPKPVSDNFNSKFPNATKVKWEQEEENEWEAEFKMNGEEMSAAFDNAGKWLETEIEISEKDLPHYAIQSFKRSFDGYKMKEVEKIESPDFSGFEMQIQKGSEKLEIQMNINGDIKAKKELGEEDEDND